jgi:phospholipase/carboxylesterase
MSLFRVDPEKPFQGPHQSQHVAKGGADIRNAAAAMILIHGRGATAQSILALADEFNRDDMAWFAPQADRHTWYPNSFLAPKEQNQPGIKSGLQKIFDIIRSIEDQGMPKDKIMLLGFSQGACLVTEFAARHPDRYGAVIGFSGGLIGPEVDPNNYDGPMAGTPVFLGCSDVDPHIPKERVDETEAVFKKLEADVTKRIYKGMPHTVNNDEIRFVQTLIQNVTKKD